MKRTEKNFVSIISFDMYLNVQNGSIYKISSQKSKLKTKKNLEYQVYILQKSL